MAREPCQKGTSFLPVVGALKAHPDRNKLVPERLRQYFDHHLVISGWYPEKDYFALLEALVKTIDAKSVGGDVWRYFAQFSVKRDLAGAAASGSGSSEPKGVYRNFVPADGGDLEPFFRRAMKLWSQYHDTGTMQLRGGRASKNVVVVQLVGFFIPIDGFVKLQGYYLEEFGRLVGIKLESHVTQSTARGSARCEWEYTLARTPASEAYVASLPAVS